MKSITLYSSDTTGDKFNTTYPHTVKITLSFDLTRVAEYDHTPCLFSEGGRKDSNILKCDNVCLDIDNTHSEDEAEWVTLEKIQSALNVCFYLIPSRNHNREKNGQKPRPKYHLYFPLDKPLTSAEEIRNLKQRIFEAYPSLHFDKNALEASKFFFGYKEPKPSGAVYHDKDLCIDTQLAATVAPELADWNSRSTEPIYEGSRNNALHEEALKIYKRYGITSEAEKHIAQLVARLTPPLPSKEVSRTLEGVRRFVSEQIQTRPDYIPPEFYNLQVLGDLYAPLNDTNQAEKIAELYQGVMMYSSQTGWLVYDGKVWKEDKQQTTVEKVKELNKKQLAEITRLIQGLRTEEENHEGAFDKKDFDKKLKFLLNKKKEVEKRQSYVCIKHALALTQSALSFDFSILDGDGYLLNTPTGSVNLRTGEKKQHSSDDFCTKITRVSPSRENMELWQHFLDEICEGNAELVEYLQLVCGSHIIGEITTEQLVIHQGGGANGKSTFNNAILEVLGDYGLTINADLLTTKGSQVYRYQIPRLRGARYVVAGELSDNTTLDTALLKQLCSTDFITGEAKFKEPQTFKPTHHINLYTNHAPDIKQTDTGTWRRIVVVPFNARFEGSSKKNYARTLVSECGGAILQWLIDGAKKFIASGETIQVPQCVQDFTKNYKEGCDWLALWLDEKCQTGKDCKELATILYQSYKGFAFANGEHLKTTRQFYKALETKGFKKMRINTGYMFYGVELNTEFQEMEGVKL